MSTILQGILSILPGTKPICVAISAIIATAAIANDSLINEKQMTRGALHKDLDNNINFSPDGTRLVFDYRGEGGINTNTRVGILDLRTGRDRLCYEEKPPIKGLGAPSFINNTEIVAIHALTSGITYDLAVRGGMIIPADGSGRIKWLDSRNVTAPFTPGALRGGTHKHEPDASGEWIGFTYNDLIMKTRNHSDLRNVGVCKRGIKVQVPDDPKGQNFTGESFAVLLTACVDNPAPGTDEYQRAEADCWVGREGYPTSSGGHQRARAFRGAVAVKNGDKNDIVGDLFVVDVPDDITIPGPLGPLEGTETDYPKPPKGAVVRRLTHTADNPDPDLRGINGQLRGCDDGKWVAFLGKVKVDGHVENQIFAASPGTGEIRQVSSLHGGVMDGVRSANRGVMDGLRFAPNGRYVAGVSGSGEILVFSTENDSWGKAITLTKPNKHMAVNLVISPDSNMIAYNRVINGISQIFTTIYHQTSK